MKKGLPAYPGRPKHSTTKPLNHQTQGPVIQRDGAMADAAHRPTINP